MKGEGKILYPWIVIVRDSTSLQIGDEWFVKTKEEAEGLAEELEEEWFAHGGQPESFAEKVTSSIVQRIYGTIEYARILKEAREP